MSLSRLDEIRQVRLQKLAKLKEQGINPYPGKFSESSVLISQARQSLGDSVSVSGRIWRWREHGNVVFADLRDSSGQIQLLFQKKNLADRFSLLKLLDMGDILGVTGLIVNTQAGEITVDVVSFQLLSKSLRPLPDDWHGLKDEEARFRQRYLDLMFHPELTQLFRQKAVFWQSMRDFLIHKGFLEVETPVLENTAGGADANPFITHHDALDINLYLRISMGELWQKRLMVAGFDKTFEIGRQFRNEGISREHLQDYTQMEFYWAYANYEDSMKLVEDMYRHVAKAAFGKLKFEIGEHQVDLGQPWPRIDYSDILLEKTGLDIRTAHIDEIKAKVRELHLPVAVGAARGRLIDSLWKHIRRTITGPAFLVGHPVEVSPLAKRQADNPGFVERYQVIIAGSELGNGYSELNDPVDQADRFKVQQQMRDTGDVEAQMNDADFVTALEYGMPPVSGFGVSERLFSFLADKSIRETVLFPLLRPGHDNS
jgi:lysyl-tRNA synthetase, class II